MSKSTSWCSNSKAHHWVLQRYNVTEGAGVVTLPMVAQYPAQQQEPLVCEIPKSKAASHSLTHPTLAWAISGGGGGGVSHHIWTVAVHNPLSWSPPSSSLPSQQLVSEGYTTHLFQLLTLYHQTQRRDGTISHIASSSTSFPLTHFKPAFNTFCRNPNFFPESLSAL